MKFELGKNVLLAKKAWFSGKYILDIKNVDINRIFENIH